MVSRGESPAGRVPGRQPTQESPVPKSSKTSKNPAKRTINAGPSRGNNAFPGSDKRAARDTSRTTVTKAASESDGPGGKYGKGSDFDKAGKA
jgi:hypothetical protein